MLSKSTNTVTQVFSLGILTRHVHVFPLQWKCLRPCSICEIITLFHLKNTSILKQSKNSKVDEKNKPRIYTKELLSMFIMFKFKLILASNRKNFTSIIIKEKKSFKFYNRNFEIWQKIVKKIVKDKVILIASKESKKDLFYFTFL